jgi:predicted DsbA family dithiol-disulfide isomerase
MNKLGVDIWSDIACPWCYVGKRRLEAALAAFPRRALVEITWRSFELDPSAPRALPAGLSYAGRLAKKYGTSTTQAEAMIQRMAETAAKDGLDFRFDRIQSGNTFEAHQLLHFAAEKGRQDALKERFFRAYFTEGEPIGDAEALVRLAADVGLDADEARSALTTGLFAADVRADEDQARTLGITGVPFFVVAGRYAISGAQPAELLLRALEKALAERKEAPEEQLGEGAACGPAGCS